MKEYIFNLETTKIELHFEKDEYDSLGDEEKKKIKSNFLWSNKSKCWVSRSKEPNLYWSKKVANELGFINEKRVGERLTMAQQLEVKAERAEARAERYEQYALNAETRADIMQSEFNKYKQDWSWLTQPIIAGHRGSERFARQREKVVQRYEKGFDEYRKSEYFKDKALMAMATAEMNELKNIGYLDRKVKEVYKKLKKIQEKLIKYENMLHEIENGSELMNYKKELITVEMVQKGLADLMEQWEVYKDKEAFYQNCIDDLGGIKFSKDNIKVGYIINTISSECATVISVGNVNVSYETKNGFKLKCTYAEITEIVEKKEKIQVDFHNFEKGDKLTGKAYISGKFVKCVYLVINTTDKTIRIQMIEKNGEKVYNAKPFTKKPYKNKSGICWKVELTEFQGTNYKLIETGEIKLLGVHEWI